MTEKMDDAQAKKRKKICIIGAGISGITAAKACKEENLEYVIYEMYHEPGGLWRYKEEVLDEMASIAAGTIINSSKEMIAFSDFPPNPSYHNFMHNTKMIQYIEQYMEHVGCLDKIRFRHKVVNIVRGFKFDTDGQWMVDVKDLESSNLTTELFDGVMVCTGHFSKPRLPEFTGQELFKGEIIHSRSYKRPSDFVGKNVVVVGVGNSAADVAVELSMVNTKVHLSVRSGAWILPRMDQGGIPFDIVHTNRWSNWLGGKLPFSLLNSVTEKAFNKYFDHSLFRIKPKQSPYEKDLTISDTLPNRILSGTIELKNNIERLTETGVIFQGEQNEVPCDVLILATGYKINYPFLSSSVIELDEEHFHLYKHMYSPNLGPFAHTLGFILLAQPVGPSLPVAEMQSRCYALCMSGKIRLPTEEKMNKEIEKKQKFIKSRYHSESRSKLQVEWIDYLDDLAKLIGCKPKMSKYLIKDFPLWKKLLFGTLYPYQYRLQGPHKWPGARKTIMTAEERIKAPFDSRKLTDRNGNIERGKKVKKVV